MDELSLPPGVVKLDPKALSVTATSPIPRFRNAIEPFATQREPHFQLFDPAFKDILGTKPELKLVADVHEQHPGILFAHEAPVWVRDENSKVDEMWFCSSAGTRTGEWHKGNNVISKIDLNEVEKQWNETKLKVAVTEITTTPTLYMTNGGTIYRSSSSEPPSVLFVQSGQETDHAPNVALVSTTPNKDKPNEYNATVILDNFLGRQFNSLNDVVVHPQSHAIFFTDPTYGSVVGFRPKPALPVQVYRFDPVTGAVRVVADGFYKANGIAFSPDGRTAYVNDSGAAGEGGFDATKPATVYAFDVSQDRSQTFLNRRVFAYVDTTIPDGFAVDQKGNLYVASGDGVAVYDPFGTLLGKIFIGSISANIAFAGNRLVILAEDKIFVAKLGVEGMELDFWR